MKKQRMVRLDFTRLLRDLIEIFSTSRTSKVSQGICPFTNNPLHREFEALFVHPISIAHIIIIHSIHLSCEFVKGDTKQAGIILSVIPITALVPWRF